MRLSISIYSELGDGNGLDHCEVTIDEKLARRIKLFSDTAKKIKAAYVEDWSTVDEFYNYDDEVWQGSSDCGMLRVSEKDFYWTGNLKHTDIVWETETVPMKVVDEILMVADTPRDKLPLLINTPFQTDAAKRLLEKRLRKHQTRR